MYVPKEIWICFMATWFVVAMIGLFDGKATALVLAAAGTAHAVWMYRNS